VNYPFSWKLSVAIALRNPMPKKHRRKFIFRNDTIFQELMDCLDCGECCHARDGTILIVDEDIEMWRNMGETSIIDSLVEGHFGRLAFPMSGRHRCIYQGTDVSPNACSIYEKRATICRSFEMLCPQCLDIRRNRHRPL
jgi:Fe-S-cluster containining protein